MAAHGQTHVPSRPAHPGLWVGAAILVGLGVGLSAPFLIEGAAEVYGLGFGAIVLAGIWVMPRLRSFDDRSLWVLFLVMLALFCIYPQYIALRITGLPWISPVRLVLAVLLIGWLYALRTSPDMQERLKGYIARNKVFFGLFAVFTASQALGVLTSKQPADAATKLALFQFYWTFPFLAVLSLVRTQSRLDLFLKMFLVFATIQCLVGFLEARQERLLWLDYLPPGFAADSEVLQRILQGAFRAEGYRVQGSFSVSLLYAEFLVLMLPFALFAFLEGRSWPMRLFALAVAVCVLPAQYLSGSRLGMVGALTVFALLGVLYAVRAWRNDRRSMYGPFLILLLPFGFMAFAAAFASSRRLRVMTIGGGQHQASTDSRLEMWAMSPPKLLERPLFGHGPGRAAETLGFTNPSGTLTIDSYWLSALLEFGAVGAVALFGMLAWCVYVGIRAYLDPSNPHGRLGGPLALALIAFGIIKLVLSQVDNHLIVFVMMALIILVRTGLDPLAQAAASPGGRQVAKTRPRLHHGVPVPAAARIHGAAAGTVTLARRGPPRLPLRHASPRGLPKPDPHARKTPKPGP